MNCPVDVTPSIRAKLVTSGEIDIRYDQTKPKSFSFFTKRGTKTTLNIALKIHNTN